MFNRIRATFHGVHIDVQMLPAFYLCFFMMEIAVQQADKILVSAPHLLPERRRHNREGTKYRVFGVG